MTRAVNKVILLGTLGSDPEIRNLTNGSSVANISLATNESWKDKNTGQVQEKTEWHRVVVFGKLAKVAEKYLQKGSQVYFEGKIQTRKWRDQSTGLDKYTTEVVVDFGGQMHMLSGANDQVNYNQLQVKSEIIQKSPNTSDISQSYGEKTFEPLTNKPSPNFDFDDDIPF